MSLSFAINSGLESFMAYFKKCNKNVVIKQYIYNSIKKKKNPTKKIQKRKKKEDNLILW